MDVQQYWHSVTLERDLCKGCTNCLKQCPTQAIRVQGGKAKILKERCIDCGECIRVCPYHAKRAVVDNFEQLQNYKYTVALVAPAFYGQFSKTEDCNLILSSLLLLGFDHVYDVAKAAQEISKMTRKLLVDGKILKPAISSACPAVRRLIEVRFPSLIEHIIPLRAPMELAAESALHEAMEKTGLKEEEIGIFFISPCAAKATAVKTADIENRSYVTGVLSLKDIYLVKSDFPNLGIKLSLPSEKVPAPPYPDKIRHGLQFLQSVLFLFIGQNLFFTLLPLSNIAIFIFLLLLINSYAANKPAGPAPIIITS